MSFASRAQLVLTVLGGSIGAIAIARYEDAVYAETPHVLRAPKQHDRRPSGPIDLNSASAAELERVPGIGPRLAERIVAHRAAHGPFARADDLDQVPGVGPKLLAKLRGALGVLSPQNSSNSQDTRARASLTNDGEPSPK